MRYITSNISALNSESLSAKNSGLGNVLFQVASIIGIARLKGLTATFPAVDQLSKKLYSLYKSNHGSTIYRNLPTYSWSTDNNYIINESTSSKDYDHNLLSIIDTIVTNDDSQRGIIVRGYLENSKYFEHMKDEILELFRPDADSVKYIRNKYNAIFETNKTLVSVHFRGNEYKKSCHAEAIGVATEYNYSYYSNAINYIIDKVNNPLFLIFTDDIASIDFNQLPLCYNVIISNNPDYIDLWFISMCHHNILSFSTFSYWGAILNSHADKLVLYDAKLSYEYLRSFVKI